MSRFIESIRYEEGKYHLLDYHQERINRVFHDYFESGESLLLNQILDFDLDLVGKYKCRLVFDLTSFKIEFIPYDSRKIESLKIVVDNEMDYSFKYEDRTALKLLFENRGGCDDILIVKDNQVTDSSYANLLFEKNNVWYTSDSPLLKGVQRQYLLDTGKVSEIGITVDNLHEFSSFMICNSMLPFESERSVATDAIVA